jgi:hypothetical protein
MCWRTSSSEDSCPNEEASPADVEERDLRRTRWPRVPHPSWAGSCPTLGRLALGEPTDRSLLAGDMCCELFTLALELFHLDNVWVSDSVDQSLGGFGRQTSTGDGAFEPLPHACQTALTRLTTRTATALSTLCRAGPRSSWTSRR